MIPRRLFLGIAVAGVLAFSGGPAGAVDRTFLDGAREFISVMAERVLDVVRNPESTREQRIEALRGVFNEGFDVKAIARFVLGRYWRLATQEEKEAYLAAFEDYVVRTYAARFDSYHGEEFVVKDVRPDGAVGAMVLSEITSRGGNTLRLDWRVRKPKGKYAVVDVLVEGVSMAVTQRSEFASVMQKNNGELLALVSTLREKTAQIRTDVDTAEQ